MLYCDSVDNSDSNDSDMEEWWQWCMAVGDDRVIFETAVLVMTDSGDESDSDDGGGDNKLVHILHLIRLDT